MNCILFLSNRYSRDTTEKSIRKYLILMSNIIKILKASLCFIDTVMNQCKYTVYVYIGRKHIYKYIIVPVRSFD